MISEHMNYKKLSLLLILLVISTSCISQSIAEESKVRCNSVIHPTRLYSSVYRETPSIYTRSLELLFMSSQYSDENGVEEQQIIENKRHLLRDLGNMGKIYLSDSWHIYSSPARIGRRDTYWLAAFTAATGILYAYDQDIYNGLKRNQDDKLYKPFRKIGKTFEPIGMMGTTNKYYVGALATGYIFRIRPLMEISAQILESHFIAGGVKNVANILVGRSRPHEGKGPRNFEFNNGTSFPSGHASSIFQVATVLSHHLKFRPATLALYGLATTVAFQRVTSDSHWPSDVFIAAIYGMAVSRAVISLHENRKAKLITAPLIKGEAIGMSFNLEF